MANYGTIRGIITNGQGTPIPGVTLQAKIGSTVYGTVQTHSRDQSYNNGTYTYAAVYRLDLAPGTYTVYASCPGYNPQTVNNVVVTAGQDTTLNFTNF